MKKHITCAEAEEKYGLSRTTLRRLVRQGLLRPVNAEAVGFETNRGGPRIRWVYDEQDILALTSRSKSVRHRSLGHIETTVFNLFDQGMNAVAVVRRTKLGIKEVQELRDIYVREMGVLVVPENLVTKLKDAGFPVESVEAFVASVLRLLAVARGQAAKARIVAVKAESSTTK